VFSTARMDLDEHAGGEGSKLRIVSGVTVSVRTRPTCASQTTEINWMLAVYSNEQKAGYLWTSFYNTLISLEQTA